MNELGLQTAFGQSAGERHAVSTQVFECIGAHEHVKSTATHA